MAKPPLNGVAETEYTKSQQGGLTPSSFQTTGGVHELVARVMRGKYVRQMAKRKSAVSRSPQSHLYHASEHITRESRADSCTHCLHARIYRWELTDSRSERGRRRRDRASGRGFNMCADGTIKTNPISLCSHPNFCQKLNREVRRSLTWHSSKSESALERFEPVAADKLRLDGSLAMFAPEGDGCLNRARREDAGRIHKAGTTLCDFCRAFRQ